MSKAQEPEPQSKRVEREVTIHMPGWARRPFRYFLLRMKALDDYMHITVDAFGHLEKGPQIVQFVIETERFLGGVDKGQPMSEKEAKALKIATERATFAASEMEAGFPLLYEQAVVSLWAWLDNLVKGLIAGWLEHRPGATSVREVAKLRVKVGEYETLTPEERCSYIVEILEQDLASSLRHGVNRFECLLNPFGISGDLSENDRKNLFEFEQVRNVIVHRDGRADNRLVRACPWLGLKVGDKVPIGSARFGDYVRAAGHYEISLLRRVNSMFEQEVVGTQATSPLQPDPDESPQAQRGDA